ncbi:hypothetical protein [Campylobacter sputorum]|uniref:hypothetical protein n=1 Tax=Campylobacter sputorum TaxID=206 RepID=UPI000B795716|nr:hypothetical protein [Campylobacter sputorum]
MAKQNARFAKYFYQSTFKTVQEFIKVNDSEVDWKEKSIVQLEELLNKKYTKEEQEYILNIPIEDIETIGDTDLLIDHSLISFLDRLKQKVAQGGKLSIWDRIDGWGTEQQRKEIEDFFDSLPKGAYSIGDFGSWLLRNYFDEDITEFKRLYTEDREKSTAARRAEVAQFHKELREYNEKLAKEREKEILDKYKPIEGKTFNKETYDMQNDPRLFYASKLLQRQNKEDVKLLLGLMEKLEKKIGVDVRV